MNNLGYLYEHGMGVTHDYAKARQWYALSAEQGGRGRQTASALARQSVIGGLL